MPAFRILLVDDNPAFLDSACRLLATYSEIEVVGCALSAPEAIEKVAQLSPDVVLMDISMPEMDGLAATRRIKSQPHAPSVVIATLHDSQEYRRAAASVQADAFIPKSELGARVVPLIHSLLDIPTE